MYNNHGFCLVKIELNTSILFSPKLNSTITFLCFSYFHKIHSELQKIKEAIVNYWNKTVGLINKTISDYPLLAYGASVGRKMYRFGKTMSEQYTMESSFRQLIRRFIGRVDSLASTLVRAIDVVYHKKSLMSYEYTYDLQDGQVSYVQVLPFQWYRFDDTPDIGKRGNPLTNICQY